MATAKTATKTQDTAAEQPDMAEMWAKMQDMETKLSDREQTLAAREDALAQQNAEDKETIRSLQKQVAEMSDKSKTEAQMDLEKQHALRDERANIIKREYTYQKENDKSPRKLKVMTAVEKNIVVGAKKAK